MKTIRANIGQIIRQKVEESGMSQAKFAESIGLQRQNIRKSVFDKHSIDTDLLCTICEVLNHDFFYYFHQCNINNYTSKEVKAKISIELGSEKQDKTFTFIFGDNKIKVE